MKIIKKIFIATFIMLIFVGCGSRNNNEVVGTIPDFFPFEENTTYVFTSEQVIGNQEIFTAYINDNKKQQRVIAHNNEITAVLEYTDGKLIQSFSFLQHYLYEDVTGAESNMNIVILSEPLKLGNSWETGDSDGVSTITSVDAIVETPMGTFEAIEVTTEFRNGDIETVYFARDMGIIKTDYTTTTQDATISVTSVLTEVIRDTGLEVSKTFYYPDEMLLNLESENKTLVIETNQDFAKLFEDALRQVPEGSQTSIIGNDTKINSIGVDRQKDLVTVDFSSNFLNNVSGGGQEAMVLQALANTFGRFYRVNNLRITLDGNNYESSHFYIDETNFISVY